MLTAQSENEIAFRSWMFETIFDQFHKLSMKNLVQNLKEITNTIVLKKSMSDDYYQKYSRLRCFLCVKGLVICFYLGSSGSILQFRQNIIKVGSKS